MLKDRLKEFRKYKKLTGEAFGVEVGLTKQQVSNIENGVSKLDIEILEAIINRFPDLNVYWLVAGKGDMLQETQLQKNAKAYWDMLQMGEQKNTLLSKQFQLLMETHSSYLKDSSADLDSNTGL